MRLNRVGVLAVVHLCEKKEQLFNSFYAQTLSGSSPAQNKKEPPLRLFFLVRETGLGVCCGCALHADGSPTVASDSTRLTAPR